MRADISALLGLGLVLACLASGGLVHASAPDLVVRLHDGQTSAFSLDTVTCLEFEADSLRVQLTGGATSFAVGDVAAITYTWHPTGIADQDPTAAASTLSRLLPNRPNPASPETRIAFDLPRAGPVRLDIFGVDGRLIRSLIDEPRAAGRHHLRWDGRDDAGRPAASGVYLYRLEALGVAEHRKLVLVR